MRSSWIVLCFAAAALTACGGGGESGPTSSPDSAQPPVTDPTATWPVKPLLGTWTGTMKRVSVGGLCTPYPDAVDRPQSLTIASENGTLFSVKPTPVLDGTGDRTEIANLNWTGTPAFALNISAGPHGAAYGWNFTVVAPDQAEIRFTYSSGSYIGEPCSTATWAGTLSRQ